MPAIPSLTNSSASSPAAWIEAQLSCSGPGLPSSPYPGQPGCRVCRSLHGMAAADHLRLRTVYRRLLEESQGGPQDTVRARLDHHPREQGTGGRGRGGVSVGEPYMQRYHARFHAESSNKADQRENPEGTREPGAACQGREGYRPRSAQIEKDAPD